MRTSSSYELVFGSLYQDRWEMYLYGSEANDLCRVLSDWRRMHQANRSYDSRSIGCKNPIDLPSIHAELEGHLI